MKIKSIFLVSILLLAIITIGAVSAEELTEDTTDDLSIVSDDVDLQTTDDAVASEGEKKDLEWEITNDEEMVNYTTGKICHNGYLYSDDEDNQYPIQLLVDGNEKETNVDDNNINFDTSDLALGQHNYTLNFLGNKIYNPATATGSFLIKDIAVNADKEYTINAYDGSGSIDIILPTTVSGEISVTVDNETQTKQIEFEEYELDEHYKIMHFNLANFLVKCGQNNVTVKLNDTILKNYQVQTNYTINVNEEVVKYGNGKYIVELPIGMDPDLATITIDGKKQQTEYEVTGDGLQNGARLLSVNTTKELTVGNHTVIFAYAGDDIFTNETFEGTMTVIPILEVPSDAMREDNFTLTMPDDCNETLEIYVQHIDDAKPYLYASTKASGDISISLKNLTKVGNYFFDIKPLKSYKIYMPNAYFTLNPDIVYPKTLVIGSNETISIDYPNHKGRLTVYDNNNILYNEADLIDGKVSISLSTIVLPEGKQDIRVEFFDIENVNEETGYEYGEYYNYYLKIDVIKPEITLPASKITVGENASVSVDLPGMNGTLVVRINVKEGEGAAAELVNGKATVPVVKLTQGKNSYYAHLILNKPDSDGNITSDEYSYYFNVTVVNPITAGDTSVIYSANGNYKVQLKDANGNPINSRKVTFYILDGKKQILKKTVDVKNGAATLSYKITKAAKTYTIKTEYNKAQVTKKLTVKHAITLKTVKVKKSAKKLVLQVKLAKINGKILKNKKITFKFKGKKYTAKTNKKGIAKVTVKSSVLKKLKVGKKVTYQATYLKDTVKKTAKVKK